MPDDTDAPPTLQDIKRQKCHEAREGLKTAEEGLRAISEGAKSYRVGTRSLHYRDPSEQSAIVDYWRSQVEFYCGDPPLPLSVSGRNSAARIVPRDV